MRYLHLSDVQSLQVMYKLCSRALPRLKAVSFDALEQDVCDELAALLGVVVTEGPNCVPIIGPFI